MACRDPVLKEERLRVSRAAGDASVRMARAEDGAAIYELASDFATSFVVERAAFDRSFAELIVTPHAVLGVAVRNEHIVGYVLGFAHTAFYANASVAWVEEIAVSAPARRKGIGRQLMAFFETWAHERGCRLVALATRRASPFYESMGYEASATYYRKLL